MANGSMFDPSQFSIAPGDMRSLQDRLLEYRRSLPPSLQGPEVGGQPQQTQPEQQQSSLVKQILSQAPGFLGQAAAVDEAGGEKPKPKTIDERNAEMQKVVNQGTNPFAPKESIGSPFLGKLLHGQDEGGILGTGIQPLDVLAFALGAAITSKMPQDKAIATTMMFAKMPSEFRKNQADAADNFIKRQLAATNAATGMANAQTSQMKAVQVQQEYEAGIKLADTFRKAGKPNEALAIEADKVNDYVKLSGGDMPNLPPHLADELDIIAGGGPISPALRQRGIDSPEKARMLLERTMSRQRPIVDESGQLWVGTPEGYRPSTTIGQRPAAPTMPAAVTPTAPVITPTSQEPVRRLEPTPSGGFMPPRTAAAPQTQELVDPKQIYAAMTPDQQLKVDLANAQMEKDLGLRMPKELDVGTKAKILSSKSALQYAQQLDQAYEKMVKSYGGDKKFDFNTRQKIYLASRGPAFAGGTGSTSEAVVGTAAGIGAAALAEYGGLTQSAKDFIALHEQAQRFARGAMQDTGNLALNERARFEAMLGQMNREPSFFRSSLGSFYKQTSSDFNDLLRMNVQRIPKGFGVMPTELRAGAGAATAPKKEGVGNWLLIGPEINAPQTR